MTKEELKDRLSKGDTLHQIFLFRNGQECSIYKASEFSIGQDVIYIPDLSLHEISVDLAVYDEEDQKLLFANCYTGDDFVDVCCGDHEMARKLFDWCDWQSPDSAVIEVIAAYSDEPTSAFFG